MARGPLMGPAGCRRMVCRARDRGARAPEGSMARLTCAGGALEGCGSECRGRRSSSAGGEGAAAYGFDAVATRTRLRPAFARGPSARDARAAVRRLPLLSMSQAPSRPVGATAYASRAAAWLALDPLPAMGDERASAGARSAPAPLLHPWRGSSDALSSGEWPCYPEVAARDGARRARRRASARLPYAIYTQQWRLVATSRSSDASVSSAIERDDTDDLAGIGRI